jgi:DNA (cytosine-5)-methyltransferase 1
MPMSTYYNEIEPFAADWLRNLIAAGHIAPGDVDDRSIGEVTAGDLAGYDQCHFFAGIGVWSYALRGAGWADDRKVWTGSCPCQPFSVAGLGQGFADERHLWPVWAKLVAECRPDVIFGEQVANNDALAWLDVVQADLEAANYAVGTIDLCAAGLGAPHLRQRLWWVAESNRQRRAGKRVRLQPGRPLEAGPQAARRGTPSKLANGRVLGDADGAGPQVGQGHPDGRRAVRIEGSAAAQTGAVSGYWSAADLIWCRDGKYRPVEPGTFPLAHGTAESLVRMRAEEYAAAQEIIEFAHLRKADTREILQMVRENFCAWTDREGQPTGMRSEFPPAEVLLPFLLGVESACITASNGGGISQASEKIHGASVQCMRNHSGEGCSPSRCQSDEQRQGEPPDSLPKLSLVLARRAQAHADSKRHADASSSRVGRLRATGNALVAPVAEAFVRAYMDVADGKEPR